MIFGHFCTLMLWSVRYYNIIVYKLILIVSIRKQTEQNVLKSKAFQKTCYCGNFLLCDNSTLFCRMFLRLLLHGKMGRVKDVHDKIVSHRNTGIPRYKITVTFDFRHRFLANDCVNKQSKEPFERWDIVISEILTAEAISKSYLILRYTCSCNF